MTASSTQVRYRTSRDSVDGSTTVKDTDGRQWPADGEGCDSPPRPWIFVPIPCSRVGQSPQQRGINRLKRRRAVAARYDKLAVRYAATRNASRARS
jgi:hypothetical protein